MYNKQLNQIYDQTASQTVPTYTVGVQPVEQQQGGEVIVNQWRVTDFYRALMYVDTVC